MVLNTRKNIRRKGGNSSTKDKTRRRTSSARRSVAKKRWNKIRKQSKKMLKDIGSPTNTSHNICTNIGIHVQERTISVHDTR